MRKVVTSIVTAGVAAGVIGLAPAAAQTTDNTAFCDQVLAVGKIFNQDEPDPAEADAALSELESTAPPEIAPTVQTLVSTIRTAVENESDPTEDPTFSESLAAVGEYVYTSCGWQTADVTMLEYEFDGLPNRFTTGPVAIRLTNDGAEVHELALARIKTKDSVKKLIQLSRKKAEKRIVDVAHGFAAPGETSYMLVDLTKTGRYAAVCFIPVGTTDLADLEDEHGGGGKPHAREGMHAGLKVTRA